ncbi:MAG: DUF1080 domain-containing protein [Ginsengibacter sp.]
MYKFICLTAAVAILQSCNPGNENTTDVKKDSTTMSDAPSNNEDGFVSLFDSKSINQWHTYGKPNLDSGWTIQDDAMFLDTTAAVRDAKGNRTSNNIVTNEEYGNFDLKLDWKISEKGNSGIIFYVKEDPAQFPENYNSGMEMQVLDNGTPTRLGHPDGKLYTHRAGDLYDLLAAKEVAKPLGEWNAVEIVSNNGKLDFYMNGEHTLSTTLWDDNWNKMIAISKFKDMKGFGTFKQGKISLQDHGAAVWFRNIRIKKL